ncbi:hypothetical protein [Leisingera sp. NJS204]|uniref:hypothetical protein n=1 Tax=Leisingera sp. NJS204 TaxID=2508307 RepID=UPI0010108158|nr:hypothetical protein [Leisingera sp. NJS204]QAX28423.1 hypothetical protein ETW24_03005 [Leisingera sp. NJS204]
MEEGIALYNSFFTRFIRFFADRGYSGCLLDDRESFRLDFSMAFAFEWDLVAEIQSWEEWVALKDWLDAHGAQRIDVMVVARQFTYIVNEQELVSVKRVLQRRNVLPRLDQGLIGRADFESVMLGGHNKGFIPVAGKRVILIQGLKLHEEVQVGGLGKLIQLTDNYVNAVTRTPVSSGAPHLYSGFLTENPVFFERKGLISLMAALRSFQYARSGDLRYCWTIGLYRSLTGQDATLKPGGVVQYSEETSLFGTEAPRLTEVAKLETGLLAEHILETLAGHQSNLIASELFNRALLAPKHLRVPSVFSALESVFYVRDRFTKKKAIAAFVAEVLQLTRGKADFLIKMYDLRNAIIHGDEAEQQQVLVDLQTNRQRYDLKTDPTAELAELVCLLFKDLMARGWESKPDTRQLERSVFQNANLRDLLQR